MRLRPPRSTRTDTLFPYTTLFRSVPIAVFENRETGELLRDPEVNERIVEACLKGGADAWFTATPADFLGNKYNPADWKMVTDILDVWFDSGSTHSFVLEPRPDLKWPASLYLEGSDQHRGRSEEHRVGKEVVSTFKSRWSPFS